MGIGAPAVGLLYHLAQTGELNNVRNVLEFGSQNMHCYNYARLLNKLLHALGRQPYNPEDLVRVGEGGAAREFYERLGWEYNCIDTDGKYGALTLDLNFDPAPPGAQG